MPNPIDLDELITTKEAATILGLKTNTLEIYRHQGKGPPFVKIGSGAKAPVRYQRAALAEWLAQQTFTSTSAHTAAGRSTYALGHSAMPRPWERNSRVSSQPQGASE